MASTLNRIDWKPDNPPAVATMLKACEELMTAYVAWRKYGHAKDKKLLAARMGNLERAYCLLLDCQWFGTVVEEKKG